PSRRSSLIPLPPLFIGRSTVCGLDLQPAGFAPTVVQALRWLCDDALKPELLRCRELQLREVAVRDWRHCGSSDNGGQPSAVQPLREAFARQDRFFSSIAAPLSGSVRGVDSLP